jgi:flagellar hook-length control protein FliK
MHITVLSGLTATRGTASELHGPDTLGTASPGAAPAQVDFSNVFGIGRDTVADLADDVLPDQGQTDLPNADGDLPQGDLPQGDVTTDAIERTEAAKPDAPGSARDRDGLGTTLAINAVSDPGQTDAKVAEGPRKRNESMHESVTSAIMGATMRPTQSGNASDATHHGDHPTLLMTPVRHVQDSVAVDIAKGEHITDPARTGIETPTVVGRVTGQETAGIGRNSTPEIRQDGVKSATPGVANPQLEEVATRTPSNQKPAANQIGPTVTALMATVTNAPNHQVRLPQDTHHTALPQAQADNLQGGSLTPETRSNLVPVTTTAYRTAQSDTVRASASPAQATLEPIRSPGSGDVLTVRTADVQTSQGGAPMTAAAKPFAEAGSPQSPAYARSRDERLPQDTQVQPAHAAVAPQSPVTSHSKLQPLGFRITDPLARQTSDVLYDASWDIRPHAASTATAAQLIQARTDLPPHVAQHIAQTLHRMPDRPLEIALNPAELGRVRMTLTATDSGIVVNIVADRPDTLDLMRRNIDDLGQSFKDLGYDDIAFAFGQNADPSDTSSDAQSDDPSALLLDLQDEDAAAQSHPDAPRLAIMAEGIDLRL